MYQLPGVRLSRHRNCSGLTLCERHEALDTAKLREEERCGYILRTSHRPVLSTCFVSAPGLH